MSRPDPDSKLAWTAYHHADPVEGDCIGSEFDRADIDRRNGWTDGDESPQAIAITASSAEAIAKTLQLLIPPRVCRQGIEAGGLRLVALGWMLNLDNLRDYSQAELARRAGVTKAALSAAVKLLEERTGIHCPGQTRMTACASHKAGARKGWETRRSHAND